MHTDFPIKFDELQSLLNSIGYTFTARDQSRPRIWWERNKTVPLPKGFENAPEKLTTLEPDFEADGHQHPVYDRAYILDLLTIIMGATVIDAQHQIQAVLSWTKRAEK